MPVVRDCKVTVPELPETAVEDDSLLYVVTEPSSARPKDRRLSIGRLYAVFEERILRTLLPRIAPKRIFLVGNGVDTEFNLAHNLGTKDFTWSAFDNNTGTDINAGLQRLSDSTVRITFSGEIPGFQQYRVVIRG